MIAFAWRGDRSVMPNIDELLGAPETKTPPTTPPAPASFTFDALATIGKHAKAVSKHAAIVCNVEAEIYAFESENRTIVRAHRDLLAKLAKARSLLAEQQIEALNAIGWEVRR